MTSRLTSQLFFFFLFFFFARTGTHIRAHESEGTACVVVSSTRFESFIFFFFLHVRPRTYGHTRAKERPVWLLFLACGLNLFIFCTYGHARVKERPVWLFLACGLNFFFNFRVWLLFLTRSLNVF